MVRGIASTMKNKSNKIPDDLFGSEPHRRILQSLVDRKVLRDWDACDLIYQGTRGRPPSALSTAMIEMSRLRRFLILHALHCQRRAGIVAIGCRVWIRKSCALSWRPVDTRPPNKKRSRRARGQFRKRST